MTDIIANGTLVRKKGNKPFSNGEKTATVKGVVPHPYNEGQQAYTFVEHDTVVDVRRVVATSL